MFHISPHTDMSVSLSSFCRLQKRAQAGKCLCPRSLAGSGRRRLGIQGQLPPHTHGAFMARKEMEWVVYYPQAFSTTSKWFPQFLSAVNTETWQAGNQAAEKQVCFLTQQHHLQDLREHCTKDQEQVLFFPLEEILKKGPETSSNDLSS